MTRMLVTGAAGFLGSVIADALDASGVDTIRWTRADADLATADAGTLAERLSNADVRRVVHCASLVGPAPVMADPQGAIGANVTGTLALAQACAAASVPMTLLSTADVYGARTDRCLESDHDLAPTNLYALTKLQAEQIAQLMAPAGLQILRVSSPYGPDPVPRLRAGRSALTTICQQALTGQTIPIFRGGQRSWVWGGDLAEAVVRIVRDGEQATDLPSARSGFGIFNVGREDDLRPMEDVARLVCRIAGASEAFVELVDPPVPVPPPREFATQRLTSLGWRPRTRLEDGIAELVEWVRRLPA